MLLPAPCRKGKCYCTAHLFPFIANTSISLSRATVSHVRTCSARYYSKRTHKTSFAYGGIKPGNPLHSHQLDVEMMLESKMCALFAICQIAAYCQHCALAQRHAAIELGNAFDPACISMSTNQANFSSTSMLLTFNNEVLLDHSRKLRIVTRLEPVEHRCQLLLL